MRPTMNQIRVVEKQRWCVGCSRRPEACVCARSLMTTRSALTWKTFLVHSMTQVFPIMLPSTITLQQRLFLMNRTYLVTEISSGCMCCEVLPEMKSKVHKILQVTNLAKLQNTLTRSQYSVPPLTHALNHPPKRTPHAHAHAQCEN